MSPNGIGRERFWEATRNGVSGVRRIRRFDPSAFVVQVAGEVPEEFDEKLYVEVKDRPHVSRAVPLAVASVGEAVSDAGLDVAGYVARRTARHRRDCRLRRRQPGFYRGAIPALLHRPSETVQRLHHPHGYHRHAGQRSLHALRVSRVQPHHFHGLHFVDGRLGYAYRNIQAGVLNTMIAGGVDSPIAPLILRGFQLMRIMSTRWNAEPERASRPFSRDRDGFVIAEGAWFFVLEEMERAKARGAHIYGEIAGYGSTCEAYHRVRLEECGEEPARAIGLAMEEAGIPPEAKCSTSATTAPPPS